MDPISLLSTAWTLYGRGEQLRKTALRGLGYWQGRRIKRARELVQSARFLASSDISLRYLEWKYPEFPLLKKGSYSYPTIVFPATINQASKPESVLSHDLDVSRPQDEKLIAPNAEFRAVRELLGSDLHNLVTYRMKKLNEGPPLMLECGLGSYFRALDTCDSLGWELVKGLLPIQELSNPDASWLAWLDSRLHDRAKLHKTVSDPIRDGTGRSVAIGGENAFAFVHDEQVYVCVRKRSERGVAVESGTVDVVPSYMFQPFTPDIKGEFSVAHNFYREYLEEMFNVYVDPRAHYRSIYDYEQVRYLKELEDKGLAQLWLTGISVSLVNLRPEICTLYFVRTSEWYERYAPKLRFNDEYVILDERIAPGEQCYAEIAFSSSEDRLIEAHPILQPDSMTPSGAAGFWLAIDLLKRIL